MDKFFSIIIPVYNVENSLRKCVESVLSQDVAQELYEIILVNDGSTDSSPVICKEYADKYGHVQYYSQENQGLSGARNTGLSKATGRYVCFLDSDDQIMPGSLEQILKLADAKQADIYNFRMREQHADGTYKDIGHGDAFATNVIYSGESCLTNGYTIGSVCCNMYLLSLINKAELRFTLGIVHEDVDFNFRAFYYAKSVQFTGLTVYIYNWNDASLNRSERTSERIKRSLYSDVLIAKHIKDFSSRISPSQCKDFFEKYSNSIVSSVWIQLVTSKVLTTEDKRFLYHATRENGLVPIKGKTLSSKTSKLKWFIGNKLFTQLCMRLLPLLRI